MGFREWLLGLFRTEDDTVTPQVEIGHDDQIPPEAVGAASSEQLAIELGQFRESNTRNEVLLRQVQRELAGLEGREKKQIDEVKSAEQGSFAQRMGLQEIDRLRQRKHALMQRADIYQTNIRQNNEMIHKGEMLLSMREQGVSREQLMRLEVDFQTEFQQWKRERVGNEASAADAAREVITETDRKRLEQVEREILGDARLFSKEARAAAKPAPKDEELRQMVERTEVGDSVPAKDNEPAKRAVVTEDSRE